jgi:SAM-dependent methyltransferase
MEPQEYLHMYEEEECHWWYEGMRSIVHSLLPTDSLPANPLVLDAGCGSGYNMGWLKRHYGAVVTGIDLSPDALDFCRRRTEHALIRADTALLPFSGNIYDLVISFDVITNLKNESARAEALREFLRVLKPGGRLLIRAAAYEFLRSSHDDAVMTHHRYGRRELSAAVAVAGFRLLRVTSANTILFPIALLWRMLKKWGLAPAGSDVRARTRGIGGLNRVLKTMLNMEAAVLRRRSLGFGLSIFVLAVKPAVASR